MTLQVVGAGLPRTGTSSLKSALEFLLRGRCYHMREIPHHPFDFGDDWNEALAGKTPNWTKLFAGYRAALDWPTSLFWRELSKVYPDALVLLSVRDSAETWRQSAEATILPVARMALAPEWNEGRGLIDLLERFTGSQHWDDPATLMAAYERHNDDVRRTVPTSRLIEWRAEDEWGPLCHALDLPVPNQPFPLTNRRSEWVDGNR